MNHSRPSRRRLLIGGSIVALCPAFPASAQDITRFSRRAAGSGVADHGAFDVLVARRARSSRDGVVRVDYAGWKASAADRAALRRYIGALSALDPLTLTRPEQFAFWANLYNALTLEVVVEAYPVRSIRDIRSSLLVAGPWRKSVARIDGVALTLDNIEHDILRKGWNDPRVHYAVNCASISCPNLPLRAWRGATLEAGLNAAARAYVNHSRGVRFDGADLVTSSIYDWYADDFGGSDPRVIAHLAGHARPALKSRLATTSRIARHAYDWALNATPGA